MLTQNEELTAYEAKLARSERLIAEAQAAIAAATATIERETPTAEHLRLIVKGMRGLFGVATDPTPALSDMELRELPDTEPPARAVPPRVPGGSKMTYGGLPSIPAVILAVLGPHDNSLNAIYHAICAHSAYDGRKKPSRGSVNNRLNEMAERGEIVKVRKGVYRSLPRSGGAENPDESGGPNPAVQLDAEKPPAEEIAPPQPGQPYGEGSAKAASRF